MPANAVDASNLPRNKKVDLPTTTVKLLATQAGVPFSEAQFQAENFEYAYQEIQTGEFDESDFSSSSFYTLSDQFSVDSSSVTLPNGLRLGIGIENDAENAQKIIETLYNYGEVEFLQVLNGDSLSSPRIVKFHVPGNAGRYTTDQNGTAEAQVEQGLTGIIESSNLVKLVTISASTRKISIDMMNTSPDLSVTLMNASDFEQDKDGEIVVGYGQQLHYRITLKKAFIQSGDTQLVIRPNPNIVIDSISEKYSMIPTIPDTLDASQYISQSSDSTMPAVLQKVIADYLTKSVNSYNIAVPSADHDISIDVTAHLAPDMKVAITLSNFPQIGETQPVTLDFSDTSLMGESSTTRQQIDVGKAIDIQADNKEADFHATYQTTSVKSGGINFVTVDGAKSKLVSGAQYLLGKTVGTVNYLYSSQGWRKVDGDLSRVSAKDYSLIRGGQMYTIDSRQLTSAPIALDTNVWGFDADRQNAVNQSLIQIRGLAAGKGYFFYEVGAPKGYVLDKKVINFTISSTSLASAHNSAMLYKGQIPSYTLGVNEYNILPVDLAHLEVFSSMRSIIVPIGIAVVLIVAFCVFLVAKKEKAKIRCKKRS
jgi:hypothetical protein